VVVGVSDIDAQMRREQEQARALRTAKEAANRDALTGVKSKHAFAEAEAYWNELLSRGEAEAFAVAVCDLNGLKAVNDTQGHKAGDQYIREASAAICNTFKHSPVYRIGGDEFVVILSGSDYAARIGLLDTFSQQNAQRAREGGVVVACGMADLKLDRDNSIEEVFVRADAAMYENKTYLKGIRA
jgi:diguanylate cyclase (GGDEF)-like protein